LIKLDKHYVDPRLVDLYDIENPRGADTDFYLNLTKEIKAHKIIDLGCGTGLLTCEFAEAGHEVTGVDPAAAMLSVAKQKPAADKITWIEGTASAIGQSDADLLTMTGNVAQIFLDDSDWLSTLKAIYAALKPGGYLAFESRNPLARGWEQWNKNDSYFEYESPHGLMKTWVEVVNVSDERVKFEGHNVFASTGEVIVVDSELRFRSYQELTQSLRKAGFSVDHVYGNWDKTVFEESSRTMIFVAKRDES